MSSFNLRLWVPSALFVIMAVTSPSLGAITEETCEVCVKFLRSFESILTDEIKAEHTRIEDSFKEFCKESKGKDNRFCYYIGGMSDSATYILGEMSRPLSWSMPVEKVCEKLHKKDSQICELKYDKQIDFKTVDLKKLKVKDLKKILDNWGESCDGCLEKPDFIKMIESLKSKYVREEL